MRFATWEAGGRLSAGVVGDGGLHPLPEGTTVLDLVRAGLPAALEAGTAALSADPVPLDSVRLLRAGVEKIWGPGRHMAGNNTFSFFLDPHGNTIEYTTELEILDEDTWHPHVYDFSNPEVSDQWGTANAMNEFVAQRSFNDPDKGLFVAPPV